MDRGAWVGEGVGGSYSPWGRKESHLTGQLSTATQRRHSEVSQVPPAGEQLLVLIYSSLQCNHSSCAFQLVLLHTEGIHPQTCPPHIQNKCPKPLSLT